MFGTGLALFPVELRAPYKNQARSFRWKLPEVIERPRDPVLGERSMKITVIALFIFCATIALGQSGVAVLNNQAQVVEMDSHPEHASQMSLAPEQNILGNSSSVSAHGERPLWELAPVKTEIPLGDVARMERKQHANDKKAPVVWHN
jgi:hypothetical protein